MIIWMKVTRDKYELPVAVADSAAELARKLGVSKGSIESSASQQKRGLNLHSIYRRVEVDDEEEK